MPTQNVNLSPQQAKFIKAAIKSGQFQNASEVVRAGLHLLKQHAELDKVRLERLKKLVKEGFDEIDHGEFEVVTDKTLDGFIRSLSSAKRRAKSA